MGKKRLVLLCCLVLLLAAVQPGEEKFEEQGRAAQRVGKLPKTISYVMR